MAIEAESVKKASSDTMVHTSLHYYFSRSEEEGGQNKIDRQSNTDRISFVAIIAKGSLLRRN